MIRKLVQRFRHRRVSRKVRDREIQKLVRKLPVLLPKKARQPANLRGIAHMVKGHSFLRRSQRLQARYFVGKMTYADWVKYERALSDREVIVTDSIGNTFRVDRKIITRGIDKLRKLVG